CVAELLISLTQSMTPRVLAQYQSRIRYADRLRCDDFVCQGIFDHAVLMDSGSVGKSIESNDGFIRLYSYTSYVAQHLAGGIKLFSNNPSFVRIHVGPYF